MPMHTSLLSRTSTLVSLASIALVVVLIAFNVPPILRALQLSHGDVVEEIDGTFAKLTQEHLVEQDMHAARFKGRSLFFRPQMPAVVRTPEPVRVERDPRPTVDPAPPPPPPPPRTYSGPAIVAFDGERVWFANGELIPVGEESGGIRVISVHAPWAAEIAYAGWEGRVQIFPDFDPDRIFRSAIDSSQALPMMGGTGTGGAAAAADPNSRPGMSGRTTGRPTASPARGRDRDNGAPPE